MMRNETRLTDIMEFDHVIDDHRVGFADPSEWCWDGEHHGPVVCVGDEPIDHGVGFLFRCETCLATGNSSIDIDDISWGAT